VPEAAGADIENLGLERGYRTLTITGKGGKAGHHPARGPHRPRDRPGIGERTTGPVFLAGDGRRLGRPGAARIVQWARPPRSSHHRRARRQGCRCATGNMPRRMPTRAVPGAAACGPAQLLSDAQDRHVT
jgi:hypothetical protein